ncbi:hypothetical protein, partial [Ellagibacter sp.]|uniref:hypothetical protein n=1 Tax=Ellagibacter sp. TaxID=2137578 RepID=UPI003AB2BC40
STERPDLPQTGPYRPGKTQDGRSRARPANCENSIYAASVRLEMKINQRRLAAAHDGLSLALPQR